MEAYANEEEVELADGACQGLDPQLHGDVDFARLTYPDGRVSGFGAWSTACEYCGDPVEGDEGRQSCGPRPVACPACGEVANSKECSRPLLTDQNLRKEMEAKP